MDRQSNNKKASPARRWGALLAAAALLVSLTACGEKGAEKQVFAMDTVMLLKADGAQAEAAVQEAEAEMYRLDALLSLTQADSEVSRLNAAAGPCRVSAETYQIIDAAMRFGAAAGGAFDITIAPVASAWGFTEDAFRVPGRSELEELLTHVGPQHIWRNDQLLEDGTYAVELDPGTQIDRGGIAQGYAADRAGAIFRRHGVTRGTISLGGNILALGSRSDGTPWRVGVQDPKRADDPNGLVGILHLSDACAVTSGSYQRFFEENGKIYHHILDPATGCPADSGLTSVTVVADGAEGNGTMCDALSTALFVLGEDRALDFWRSGTYDIELVLVTTDDRVVVTEGLRDRFTESEGSGYTYETVT